MKNASVNQLCLALCSIQGLQKRGHRGEQADPMPHAGQSGERRRRRGACGAAAEQQQRTLQQHQTPSCFERDEIELIAVHREPNEAAPTGQVSCRSYSFSTFILHFASFPVVLLFVQLWQRSFLSLLSVPATPSTYIRTTRAERRPVPGLAPRFSVPIAVFRDLGHQKISAHPESQPNAGAAQSVSQPASQPASRAQALALVRPPSLGHHRPALYSQTITESPPPCPTPRRVSSSRSFKWDPPSPCLFLPLHLAACPSPQRRPSLCAPHPTTSPSSATRGAECRSREVPRPPRAPCRTTFHRCRLERQRRISAACSTSSTRRARARTKRTLCPPPRAPRPTADGRLCAGDPCTSGPSPPLPSSRLATGPSNE